MKVFLDTSPPLADLYRSASRSVSGLEWVDDRDSAEALIAEQIRDVLEPKKTLFVGAISDFVEAVEDSTWEAEDYLLAAGCRFDPSVRSVYESLRAGQLGDLGLLRIHRWVGGDTSEWERSDDLMSRVDLALWFFGDLPETVYAVSGVNDEVMQLHLGFPKNGMAILDFAWNLPPGRDYNSLHVIGDRGAAYGDDHRNVSLLYGGDHPRALRVDNKSAEIAAQLEAWIRSEAEAEESLVSMGEVLAAEEVLGAAMQSALIGQPTRLVDGVYMEEGGLE